MRTFPGFVALLALALTVNAQGGGGGGYGGGCAPPASPAPAPAPAPSPGPGPGPAPSPGPGPGGGPGGSTPGGAPGGTTPGAGPGARGGTTPATRGGYGARGPYRGGRKSRRFSSEQQYWLSAVTLPWEGTFLPRGGGDGYDGREMTVEQAVADKGWKMKKLPTIVFLYDPADKSHLKSLAKVSSDKTFISASHYFNLFRVDVRTIEDKKMRRKMKEPTFVIFKANGKKVASVKKAMSIKPLQKSLSKVFEADFGKPLTNATAAMGAVLARKAWVEDEIRRHETVLFDPVTGKLQQNIKKAIADYKKELKDLDLHKSILTRLASGALVASK